MKRFIMLTFLIAVLATITSGCNTMRGAGEDIESVGEAVQDRTP